MRVKNKVKEDIKKGINPVTVGIVGAAATAVAAGTAIMLSDKKRRKKVGKALNQLGKKSTEWVEKARTTLDKMEKRLEDVDKRIPNGARKRIAARA